MVGGIACVARARVVVHAFQRETLAIAIGHAAVMERTRAVVGARRSGRPLADVARCGVRLLRVVPCAIRIHLDVVFLSIPIVRLVGIPILVWRRRNQGAIQPPERAFTDRIRCADPRILGSTRRIGRVANRLVLAG